MSISERAAYLRGLADGLNLDTANGEGKLLAAIIDTIGDIADELEVLTQNSADLSDELDEINDELNDIATLFDDIYDDEDEFYDDEDLFDDFGDEEDFDDEDYFDADEYFYSVKCPTCDEEIELDEATLEAGGIICPACGEELEFDIDEEIEEEE